MLSFHPVPLMSGFKVWAAWMEKPWSILSGLLARFEKWTLTRIYSVWIYRCEISDRLLLCLANPKNCRRQKKTKTRTHEKCTEERMKADKGDSTKEGAVRATSTQCFDYPALGMRVMWASTHRSLDLGWKLGCIRAWCIQLVSQRGNKRNTDATS